MGKVWDISDQKVMWVPSYLKLSMLLFCVEDGIFFILPSDWLIMTVIYPHDVYVRWYVFCHAQSSPSFFAASLSIQVWGHLHQFFSKVVLSVRRQLLPTLSSVTGHVISTSKDFPWKTTQILKEAFDNLSYLSTLSLACPITSHVPRTTGPCCQSFPRIQGERCNTCTQWTWIPLRRKKFL